MSQQSATPSLAISNLTIGYKSMRRPPVIVKEAISEAIYPGELICLIGPNGVGKSTLLRTLAGMQPALDGRVELMEDDVFSLEVGILARRLSVVLTGQQHVGLLTGYGLVGLGRHPYTDWTGRLTTHDEAVIQWAIEAVGADEIASRFVNELSDGERQKLMIARALAQEPAVMILDEPTAFLDLPRRVEIMHLLRRLARETNRAILLSTHDLDLALRNADRIWLMPSDGPLAVGAPEDLVLSGAFEAVFASEGILFDLRTGAFSIDSVPTGYVYLSGEAIPAYWTQRALEREGFAVAEEEASTDMPRIDILLDPMRWTLTVNSEQPYVANSLYELLHVLRKEEL